MKPEEDPSTQSAAYQAMRPTWDKISTLLAGTEAMREAAEMYLPRHENETVDRYDERRACSVLLNMTSMTLRSWVGRPFADPPKLSEELDEQMLAWLADVDTQGTDVRVFVRDWFQTALSHGLAHVLVDFTGTGEEESLAEGSEARPFLSHIAPENLIFASYQDGRLVHARILEKEIVRNGFAEKEEKHVRIFDETPDGLVTTERWKHDEGDKQWKRVEGPSPVEFPVIPIVTAYTGEKLGDMLVRVPLEDLADLNVRWWQSMSDQINVLTVARFPILSATGVDLEGEGAVLEVGPKRMLASESPQARFGYVEHAGAAIESGRKELEELETRMGYYGADFMKRRVGDVTATAVSLDAVEATSPLQDAAIRFNAAVQTAVQYMHTWAGRETVPAGAVTINTEFGPEDAVAEDTAEISAARSGGDLSRQRYLIEIHRRGILSDDFDFEANEMELEAEAAAFDGAPTDGEDIDPQAAE